VNILPFTPPPLRRLTPNEAAAQGFQAITSSIYPGESQIISSMERDMRGIDAVWIDYGCRIELGRKTAELRTVDPPQILNPSPLELQTQQD
jgi:hypothetical protein